jgi:hypothetical protein
MRIRLGPIRTLDLLRGIAGREALAAVVDCHHCLPCVASLGGYGPITPDRARSARPPTVPHMVGELAAQHALPNEVLKA